MNAPAAQTALLEAAAPSTATVVPVLTTALAARATVATLVLLVPLASAALSTATVARALTTAARPRLPAAATLLLLPVAVVVLLAPDADCTKVMAQLVPGGLLTAPGPALTPSGASTRT